jgi:hypothetical protein
MRPWLVLAAALLCAPPARAQDDAAEKALAESLFQQGRDAMKAGRVPEACRLFEQSQRLEPKVGTLLNLALCHEDEGKTASAWAEFTEVATLAKRREETERAELAQSHAAELEKKLSRVVLSSRSSGPKEILLDGRTLDPGVLGIALPLDPGAHVIVVSAPEKQRWTLQFDVPVGPATIEVVIPPLEDAPAAAPPPAPPPPVAAPAPPASVHDDLREDSGVPVLAWVGFGAGGIGLLTGVIAGAASLSMTSSIQDGCVENLCPPEEADRLSTANTVANVANVGFAVAGLGAIVGVIALVLMDDGETAYVRPDGAGVRF